MGSGRCLRGAAAPLRGAPIRCGDRARSLLRTAPESSLEHGDGGRPVHVVGSVRLPVLRDGCRPAPGAGGPGSSGAGAVHGADRCSLAGRATHPPAAGRGPGRRRGAGRGRGRTRWKRPVGRTPALPRRRVELGVRQRDLAPGRGEIRTLDGGLVLSGGAAATGGPELPGRRSRRGRPSNPAPGVECDRLHALHRGAGVLGGLLDLQRTSGSLPGVLGRSVRADRPAGGHAQFLDPARPGAEPGRRAGRRRGTCRGPGDDRFSPGRSRCKPTPGCRRD